MSRIPIVITLSSVPRRMIADAPMPTRSHAVIYLFPVHESVPARVLSRGSALGWTGAPRCWSVVWMRSFAAVRMLNWCWLSISIHREKSAACSVNYPVRCELSGSKQPDPAVVWETIEQWWQSAFPAAICVALLTINHLSFAAGLRLLTHQPRALTPVRLL